MEIQGVYGFKWCKHVRSVLGCHWLDFHFQFYILYVIFAGDGSTVRVFGPADGALMFQASERECQPNQSPLLLVLYSDATLVGRKGSASAVYGKFSESKFEHKICKFKHRICNSNVKYDEI